MAVSLTWAFFMGWYMASQINKGGNKMRRIVAIKTSFEEAENLVAELMASGHYIDVWVFKSGKVFEVWVEDKEE